MVEIYNEKIIISGLNIERYKYTKPILRGFRRKKRKVKKQEVEENKQKEKSAYSVNRTRTEIRRIISTNPHLNKFLTLTSTSSNLDEMNKLFNLFTQRMKDRFPEFRYLCVPEFQSDIDYFGELKPDGGAVHYHILCNLRYIQSKTIEEIWGHGFIKIKRIDRIADLGNYLSKYLKKDMFDKRTFGKKKFFCSQDLQKPVEIIGKTATDFYSDNQPHLELIYEKVFPANEYQDDILYQILKFKNPPA